jgi:hypothetical protein
MSLLEEYAPWSISKSDLAGKCPFAFYLRYVVKTKRVEGTHAKVGITAHRAQELILRDGMAPNAALEVAFAESPNLTSNEIAATEELKDALGAFTLRMDRFKEKHGVVQEFYEQKWGITRDYKSTGYEDADVFFRGIVDYAMLTSSGYLVVVDHKSGREHPVDYYGRQLDAYAILGQAEFPHIKGVHASLHYMKTKNLVWHHLRRTDEIHGVLTAAHKEVLARRAEELEGFKPKVNKFCKWCDYLDHCETGQQALIPASKLKRPSRSKKEQSL